jgi:hypothetical protein
MPATKRSLASQNKSNGKIAPDFLAAFAALKNILAPYEKDLHVQPERPGRYWMETKYPAFKGKPLFFAGVAINKNYVSYYLMPIYVKPELAKNLSLELKKRKQGKCCFNFAVPDPVLFQELADMTRAGFACYQDKKFLAAMDAVGKAGRK